jgi:hypothetical protein
MRRINRAQLHGNQGNSNGITQGRSKPILMVDHSGRADTFIVPQTASVRQIRDLWKRFLEVPDDIELVVQTPNDAEFCWGYETAKEMVTYTFRATNFHGDMRVFGGSPHFEADQMCKLLDFKMRPLAKFHLTPRRGLGPSIQHDEIVVLLGLRILKQHLLAWNLEGRF